MSRHNHDPIQHLEHFAASVTSSFPGTSVTPIAASPATTTLPASVTVEVDHDDQSWVTATIGWAAVTTLPGVTTLAIPFAVQFCVTRDGVPIFCTNDSVSFLGQQRTTTISAVDLTPTTSRQHVHVTYSLTASAFLIPGVTVPTGAVLPSGEAIVTGPLSLTAAVIEK
ncbi:hypothetical protein ACI7RC_25775 [Brevibacillus sp. B_LB10_24]|uniref:hypothetical protein n=1 Tax=Brevibacillus sp. B_LB10_24 TaxID=3380645 RepID=UPI0038B851D7